MSIAIDDFIHAIYMHKYRFVKKHINESNKLIAAHVAFNSGDHRMIEIVEGHIADPLLLIHLTNKYLNNYHSRSLQIKCIEKYLTKLYQQPCDCLKMPEITDALKILNRYGKGMKFPILDKIFKNIDISQVIKYVPSHIKITITKDIVNSLNCSDKMMKKFIDYCVNTNQEHALEWLDEKIINPNYIGYLLCHIHNPTVKQILTKIYSKLDKTNDIKHVTHGVCYMRLTGIDNVNSFFKFHIEHCPLPYPANAFILYAISERNVEVIEYYIKNCQDKFDVIGDLVRYCQPLTDPINKKIFDLFFDADRIDKNGHFIVDIKCLKTLEYLFNKGCNIDKLAHWISADLIASIPYELFCKIVKSKIQQSYIIAILKYLRIDLMEYLISVNLFHIKPETFPIVASVKTLPILINYGIIDKDDYEFQLLCYIKDYYFECAEQILPKIDRTKDLKYINYYIDNDLVKCSKALEILWPILPDKTMMHFLNHWQRAKILPKVIKKHGYIPVHAIKNFSTIAPFAYYLPDHILETCQLVLDDAKPQYYYIFKHIYNRLGKQVPRYYSHLMLDLL